MQRWVLQDPETFRSKHHLLFLYGSVKSRMSQEETEQILLGLAPKHRSRELLES